MRSGSHYARAVTAPFSVDPISEMICTLLPEVHFLLSKLSSSAMKPNNTFLGPKIYAHAIRGQYLQT